MGSHSEPDSEWLKKRIEKFGACGYGGGQDELKEVVGELRAIGLARLLPLFHILLADPDPETRGTAAIAILSMQEPESVDLVLPLLEDPDEVVRWGLCERLYGYGDHRAIGPLIHRLKHDTDPMVRNTAAFSLGGIGSPLAIPELIAAMENDHECDELGFSASWTAMSALDRIMDTEHTRIKVSETLNKMRSTMPDPERIKREALAFYESYLNSQG